MSGASGPYIVQYDPTALKELTKLDKPVARRIVRAIDALKVNPRPSGCRPLVDYPHLWRIRVGNYRVILHDQGRGTRGAGPAGSSSQRRLPRPVRWAAPAIGPLERPTTAPDSWLLVRDDAQGQHIALLVSYAIHPDSGIAAATATV